MSSILTPQGMAFATAMAVSGTVILLAFRLQKPVDDHVSPPPHRALRSCMVSDEKRRVKNKKKRVHFAADVVDPSGYSEEFRRQNRIATGPAPPSPSPSPNSNKFKKNASGVKARGMPANRMALYNGILRDRVHRLAYSY
ncbi:hypothetical protein BT93_C0791 [Corymbia citriodora subsp. variegata]|nr:hypothetical protein BT93_C0791 [Corymbia citriodora subsp. variegata]